MRKWLNVAIFIVIGAALLIVIVPEFTKEKKEEIKVEEQSVDESRYAAENFKLPTLLGDEVELTDSRGKLTILNFWASWCGPCRDEAPHLQAFYEANKNDVQILGVNVTADDKLKNVEQFVNKYALTFPILLDKTGDISTKYGAFTIPTTVFLNKDGEIVHEIAGPLSEQYLDEIVETLQNS